MTALDEPLRPISELFTRSTSALWATTYNVDLRLVNEFLLQALGAPPLNVTVLADGRAPGPEPYARRRRHRQPGLGQPALAPAGGASPGSHVPPQVVPRGGRSPRDPAGRQRELVSAGPR
jgi:hypothetical protein